MATEPASNQGTVDQRDFLVQQGNAEPSLLNAFNFGGNGDEKKLVAELGGVGGGNGDLRTEIILTDENGRRTALRLEERKGFLGKVTRTYKVVGLDQ